MSTGKRVGMICGMLMLFLLGQCVLLFVVSTATSMVTGAMQLSSSLKLNDEIHRPGGNNAFLQTTGSKRQLQYSYYYYKGDYDYEWENQYGWTRFLNVIVFAAFWLIFCCVSGPAAWIYWKLYIYPSHDRYLAAGMIMPQELRGRFKYDLCDFSGACGACCCFTFCTWCAIGDLWYRAGHTHAISGNSHPPIQGCHGWQFFVGCCGCCILGQALDCFAPCALAALTTGLGWMNQEGGGRSGMGSIVPVRERFGIAADCNGFCGDCCMWCWCLPCQATREWQQINDALKQWPLPTPTAPPSMVVGQPVVIQAAAVEVDPKNEMPSNQVPA